MNDLRLLVVTQTVDRANPILGFFVGWIEEFARQTKQLVVLGQSAVDRSFAPNVQIRSMGKETGISRFRQVLRFYGSILRERSQYDAVLVHMTPIWVVLGWPVWFLLGKRVYLWYEVRRGGLLLKIAVKLSRRVFSAASDGVPFQAPNIMVVGHGVDTTRFSPSPADRDPFLVCGIGRITSVKHPECIIDAFAALPAQYRLVLSGPTITAADHDTLAMVQKRIAEHGITDRVHFTVLTQPEIADLLKKATLLLHASASGLDKVLLEAMASECLIASAAEAARHVLPSLCTGPRETLGVIAGYLLQLPEHEKNTLRSALRTEIIEHHSLPTLITKLVAGMHL